MLGKKELQEILNEIKPSDPNNTLDADTLEGRLDSLALMRFISIIEQRENYTFKINDVMRFKSLGDILAKLQEDGIIVSDLI